MAKTRVEKTVQLQADQEGIVLDASYADVALQNAETERAAKRGHVVSMAEGLREDADSVRLQGSKVSALVSFTDKFTVDASKPDFAAVADAVDRGQLDGIVVKTHVARVVPSALERVKQALTQAGIDPASVLSVETGYTVVPEMYRHLVKSVASSPERAAIIQKVKGAVNHTTVSKVTYKANME